MARDRRRPRPPPPLGRRIQAGGSGAFSVARTLALAGVQGNGRTTRVALAPRLCGGAAQLPIGLRRTPPRRASPLPDFGKEGSGYPARLRSVARIDVVEPDRALAPSKDHPKSVPEVSAMATRPNRIRAIVGQRPPGLNDFAARPLRIDSNMLSVSPDRSEHRHSGNAVRPFGNGRPTHRERDHRSFGNETPILRERARPCESPEIAALRTARRPLTR